MNSLNTSPYTLTVTQLKELIKDWPEVNHCGEPTEVWITTGDCLSSPCLQVELLNVREDAGKTSADILLVPSNFAEV